MMTIFEYCSSAHTSVRLMLRHASLGQARAGREGATHEPAATAGGYVGQDRDARRQTKRCFHV